MFINKNHYTIEYKYHILIIFKAGKIIIICCKVSDSHIAAIKNLKLRTYVITFERL